MERERLHRRCRPMKRKRKRIHYNGPLWIKSIQERLDLLAKDLDQETADRIVRIQMERIIRQDTDSKYYNSVADLKEIQAKFEELQVIVDKEKARLAVLYGPTTESLNDELKAKMYAETAAVEASYHKLCEQLYSKRFQIVNGLVPAKDAYRHVELRSSFMDKINNEAMKSAFEETTKNKGVPNFWLTVMKAKPVLCQQINGHDEEVLKFLKDIKLYDEPVGFKLEFEFAENSFFKNQFLTKTYHRVDPNNQMPSDSAGTIIEWYGDRHLSGHEGSFFDFFVTFPPVPFAGWSMLLFRDNVIRCALEDIIHGAIPYYLENADLPECLIVGETYEFQHEVGDDEFQYEDGDDAWSLSSECEEQEDEVNKGLYWSLSEELEEQEDEVNKSLYEFYVRI